MLFTVVPPDRRDGEIRLFFSPEAAHAASEGGKVRGVAVHYDGLLHRLIPLLATSRGWTTSARFQADGSVIARGPIPEPLILQADVTTACAG